MNALSGMTDMVGLTNNKPQEQKTNANKNNASKQNAATNATNKSKNAATTNTSVAVAPASSLFDKIANVNSNSNSNSNSSKNVTGKTSNTNNVGLANSGLQTAQEEAGVYEVVSENYLLLLGITSAIIIILIIYVFSQAYRVSRAIARMYVYQGFQTLSSADISKVGEVRVGNFYVASAYNAAHCGYQMYDYTSENIVLAALQGGARYIELNIFNSEFGPKAYPVVSMGYKQGEWKMMVSDTPLESVFEIIANNAFTIGDGKNGVNNPDDPLFIGLNLNTNSNLGCLNLIAFLITQYFGTKSNRLLNNEFSFQNSDAIADIKMSQLQGKVVILSSDGFQGSGLEEIVNYSWDNINNSSTHSMQRLHYSVIMDSKFDNNSLIEYNRTGITIIVPHTEGDFFNTNFDTTKAFDLGCQFIAMEYQYIDSNMDAYITKFKKTSFIMKNSDLQYGNTNITKPQITES